MSRLNPQEHVHYFPTKYDPNNPNRNQPTQNHEHYNKFNSLNHFIKHYSYSITKTTK
ncbi:hypothetical protein Hanom_Chr09g00865431 [Helianthus anomalus]